MSNKVAEAPIGGTVAPGFEEVEGVFRRNFLERDEFGAACAIYHKGEKVVDLWGGYRDLARRDDDGVGPLARAPRLQREGRRLLA